MEYHSDRFLDDASLLVYDINNELVCCALPQNEVDNIFHSHQGLALYGGLWY
jgi:hypothetical protein